MSYTELYHITPTGQIRSAAEFRNSHRGAMLVWSNLWQVYCKDRIDTYTNTQHWTPSFPVNDEDYDAIWALYKNEDIPKHIRAVLGSTFDFVVLDKKDAERFYNDVLEYAEMFAAGSLIKQAQTILRLSKNKILGFCWNQTSVSEGCWYKRNIHKAERFWNLYSDIDERKAPREND